MKSDNRSGVVRHCRHKDIPGVNTDTGDSTGSDDMYPIDFIFAIQGNNAELLNCFGFEVEDELEGFKTGQRAGYLAAFKVIAAAFGKDLLEGVDVN